jgi:23S rRNA pseudouridine1911/1915/1917 synthase
MEEIDTIIINETEAGERLDKVLANRYRSLHSRTYFQNLIEEGRVLVNGLLVKKRSPLQEGDEVEINFLLTPELNITPEDIPLNILYEDDAIVVINKVPGMVVHPAAGNWSGTFVNALMFHCALEVTAGSVRPGIVHRLDKDTSGVLIAAKTALAQQKLMEQFAAREVEKEYLAICCGNPGDTTIDLPIGRHPVKRKVMAVVEEGGRSAITHCKTLACDGKLSLVQVLIETGRTHQIRVHLKHRGTPVLGDALYGNETVNRKFGASRQMLHAHKLGIKHPVTGKPMQFVAPIPDDMIKLTPKGTVK